MSTTFKSKKNNASGVLASAVEIGETSLTLGSGEGALFPTSNFRISIGDEILLCTTKVGDILTIARAQEGTTDAYHATSATVQLRTTNLDWTDVEGAINTLEVDTAAHVADVDTHGATGAIVGTTNAQTLTNKTLTSPTIADFTNATHSHTIAAGGGVIQFVPVGSVFQYVSSTMPLGYLLCDGTAVSRTTYAALYTIIGTTFGTGDGTSTFNVPNFKGSVPVGLDATQTEFNALAKSGGAKTHSHSGTSSGQSVSHNHTGGSAITGYTVAAGANYGQYMQPATMGAASADHTHTISLGSGTADSTVQPYLTVNYIIKT